MLFTYARVSTVEQAADGAVSIAEQQRKCRALATMRGVPNDDVVDIVDAGVSGSVPLSERPAGKDMLGDIRAGDVIVACKLDRLFRSASDALATAESLKKKGVDLILIDMGIEPVTGNGAAKMFFGVLALMAEFERDRINERTKDGIRAKREKKGFLGGNPPLGFRVEGQGRESKLVPDEREREIIAMVREMAPSHGYGAIRRHLIEKGVPTRSGEPWQSVQVQRIIKMKPDALHSA